MYLEWNRNVEASYLESKLKFCQDLLDWIALELWHLVEDIFGLLPKIQCQVPINRNNLSNFIFHA